jgi:Tfp pilus assembly pilus retraction ATPase PilT
MCPHVGKTGMQSTPPERSVELIHLGHLCLGTVHQVQAANRRNNFKDVFHHRQRERSGVIESLK